MTIFNRLPLLSSNTKQIFPHSTKIKTGMHFWILIGLMIVIVVYYYTRLFIGFRPYWSWRIEVFEYVHSFFGSLFIIALIYSALIFWWRGAIIVLLFSILFTIPLYVHYRSSLQNIFTSIFYLCIPAIVVGYISLERNWRQKERETLFEVEKERQQYITQIFRAHEDERKAIARELHDDAIQSLVVSANAVQSLIKIASDKNYSSITNQALFARDEIMRVSEDLKKLTLDLRPGILDNLGFIPALRWLVERLDNEGQVNVQFSISGHERELPDGTDVIIFRIVQEALNNIRQHSKATQANIVLDFRPEILNIIIYDNGKGFKVPERINTLISKKKLGLIGMQERIHSLNGFLDIQSYPDSGTTILVKFKI